MRSDLIALQRSAGNKAVADLVSAAAPEQRSPVLDVIGQGGQPLPTGLRSDMEARLGHDFSDVRVHTGQGAAASAKSVDAIAYTVGNDIVLGHGQTFTGAGGQQLLAHELAHVVQQRKGPVDGTPAPGGIKISDPGDRFEREAERISEQVTGADSAGGPVVARSVARSASHGWGPAGPPVVQRATAHQIRLAKEAADTDHAAGNIAPYFTGNFLANHIQDATPEAQQETYSKGSSSKASRGQAWRKLEDRADTSGGGSGWGAGHNVTATSKNTLVVNYGPQLRYLMEAVNVEQIDYVPHGNPPGTYPYLHPVTAQNMEAITYATQKGDREHKKGKIRMGAQWDAVAARYRINHLDSVV
jgi:hypothetical protein